MLIINGKILTMEGSPIEHGFVRTRGKLIEDIGNMTELSDTKNEKIF